ncbi:PQQ-binding-like beta-propeller repeat protein [uncultured Methanospirillum sp.]|uniref:outer membrane protein assembly factor BamB family protein n=1 Tax=uncultured Methanospirillum sp. TaxID=262503 RepID=UPI0029C92E8C|nr:PQQ-binding-like beta-propeller repeat protein [uncultured Methanospirillum sp.]
MITKPFTLFCLFFLGVTLLCCGCIDLVQERGLGVNNSTQINEIAPSNDIISNITLYHGDEWSFIGDTSTKSNPIYTYSFFQIVNDTLFFNNLDHNLYALDLQTREIKWKYSGVDNPVISNNLIYFIHNGNVVAVDPKAGVERWNVTNNASILSTLQDGKTTIYFGRKDPDYLYALDALTGKEKWSSKTESFVSNSPVEDSGMVFFSCNYINVYALNASTGTEIWRFNTDKHVNSPLLTENGLLYFSDNYSVVRAIDIYSGNKIWNSSANYEKSVIREGIIYFGSINIKGQFYAVNSQNGTLIWKNNIHNRVYHTPVVEDHIVYFGDDVGFLSALDAQTGEKKWISHVDSFMVGGSPAISKGILYIGGADGYLVAVNALNGSILWKYKTLGGGVFSTPLILNEWVYYTTKDGYLHALKVSEDVS